MKRRENIWKGKSIPVKFWLWRKLFAGKQMLIPVIFLGFALVIGIHILMQGRFLWHEMDQPLEVYVMANETNTYQAAEDEMTVRLEAFDQINGFSHYARQTRVLNQQDYSAEVTVVSLEYDYLLRKYGNDLSLPYSDTMPYVILSEPVLASMRTGKLEHMEYSDPKIFAGEFFQLSGEEGNTQDIRIWGVTDGEEDVVYSVLSETEASLAQSQYILDIRSGFGLEKLLDELEKAGFSAVSDELQDVRLLAQQWQEDREKLVYEAVLGSVVFFCGLLVVYYQRIIWKLKYRDFRNYIKQFRN